MRAERLCLSVQCDRDGKGSLSLEKHHGLILLLLQNRSEVRKTSVSKIVTHEVSTSEIGSTEIALLVCEKNISATSLDDIIDRLDSKDSLLHSESKGKVLDFTLLRS